MRYPFLLADGIDRTAMQEYFEGLGIPTRMVWSGNILRQPGFAKIPHRKPPQGLPGCDRVMDRALSLPAHHGLISDDVDRMVEAVVAWRPGA
ncbi:DegT/DnrJ/EryC1/StrS family aminotransferase [Myxococcota bacterium]|nr:DegT/DnrJ/EryC1/StrS family aminotransferase [Myxococcota bacterium]